MSDNLIFIYSYILILSMERAVMKECLGFTNQITLSISNIYYNNIDYNSNVLVSCSSTIANSPESEVCRRIVKNGKDYKKLDKWDRKYRH